MQRRSTVNRQFKVFQTATAECPKPRAAYFKLFNIVQNIISVVFQCKHTIERKVLLSSNWLKENKLVKHLVHQHPCLSLTGTKLDELHLI